MATKEVLVEKESTSIVCNVCKEVIKGRIVTALGKTWHPEHFTCAHCSRAIAGDKFHQREGAVHCVECYTQNYMHRCHACREPIANKVIQAMGVSWHEEHFVCAECKKSLAGGGFMEVAGLPYCSECHAAKFAARCFGCSLPITDKAIIALDNKWHQGCFKCVDFGERLQRQLFDRKCTAIIFLDEKINLQLNTDRKMLTTQSGTTIDANFSHNLEHIALTHLHFVLQLSQPNKCIQEIKHYD